MVYQPSRRQVLAAAAGLAALGLTGCGGDDETSNAENLDANRAGAMEKFAVGDQFKAAEALSFSVMYSNHSNYPLKNDWLFWSELTKRTNVTLEPVAIPASDYEQKRSVMIGAGDAPLIIPKTYHPAENAFVSSGAILPVSDYLDLMPHFKEKIEKWQLQPELDTLRQADGKFYLLPGVHEKPWSDYSLVMRTDILKQLNLQVPKTWDEVHTVMKAMKQAYPASWPLSERFNKPRPGGNFFNILAASYGLVGAMWNYQHATWNVEAQKYEYTGASDKYRQMLEYVAKLQADGLIDPEAFTQDEDLARQKFANGKSFVISGNAQIVVNDYRPDLAKTNPAATVAKIPLPVGPAGEINPSSRLENGVMISKKARDSKNFVAMMQFIDWLFYSDAGQEFARWGVEGVTHVKDASGKFQLAPDVNMVGLNPKATKHLQKDFGFTNGVFTYGGKPELVQAFFSAEEQEIQKIMGARKSPEWVTPPPAPFTDEEREMVTLWETPLQDYVFQQTIKFALGQRPLSEWDAYVAELESKNMDQYMDMVQKARERYQKEHG
ncbi:extracellular solute-binding protein [Actinomycetes bacterium KLBMP 9797]